jgi:hypothetical protein
VGILRAIDHDAGCSAALDIPELAAVEVDIPEYASLPALTGAQR